ncbi:MAG TPA: hypothetical protein VGF12_21895 [Roseateles sp.]|uniref:hypothetical protein n=1 Tax=Roseateles sp. TaxID=1971397 RepID=UPI002ED928CE
MKALFAAAAALALATSASAAPLNFSNYGHQDLTGFGTDFTDVYTLDLDGSTWLSGLLGTGSLLNGVPAIDIRSVTLRQLGTQTDWIQTIAIDWNVADTGIESWALAPTLLGAGQWELEVVGTSYYDKAGHGYSVDMELPEPASAALAVLALAGAGLASVRRRKA